MNIVQQHYIIIDNQCHKNNNDVFTRITVRYCTVLYENPQKTSFKNRLYVDWITTAQYIRYRMYLYDFVIYVRQYMVDT